MLSWRVVGGVAERRHDEVEKSIDFDPLLFEIVLDVHVVCFPGDSQSARRVTNEGRGVKRGWEKELMVSCTRAPRTQD